jgi:drug/metabolite transporter (DMT)-like permease
MSSGSVRIAVAALLWGSWSLFFRPAERISELAPALEAFVVFAVILITTLPLTLRGFRARRPGAAWLGMAALGVFDAMNALFFFAAMQRTSLAIAVLTHYLAPILVALAAPFVLRDRLRRTTVAALIAALGGLALLLEPWRPATGIAAGAALGAVSAVFFAANILIAKRIQHWFSPLELLAWHMPTALATLAPFALGGALQAAAPEALGLIACGGLLPGAFAGALFVSGLVRVDATRASILMLLEPVSAMAIGALVWSEIPSGVGLAGAGLVLVSAWMVARAPPEPAAAFAAPFAGNHCSSGPTE